MRVSSPDPVARASREPYGVLLGSLIGVAATVVVVGDGPRGALVVSAAFTLVLVSAVAAFSPRRADARWAFALALPALVGTWASSLSQHSVLEVVDPFLMAAFFAFATYKLYLAVFHTDSVSQEKLYGASAVFLLIGTTYASLYWGLVVVDPDAFRYAEATTPNRAVLAYYSFVTLTTLGFGDIVPVSRAARLLTVSEAVIGVLYVAITIARLATRVPHTTPDGAPTRGQETTPSQAAGHERADAPAPERLR